MSTLIQPLPMPLSSNIVYDSIQVQNLNYDPVARAYTAQVYGVCGGNPLPLNIVTRVQLHRIETVVVTDAEIDAVLESKPELNNDRVSGAMARAFQRLYALAVETQETPYVA